MKQANDGQPWSPLGLGNPSASCLRCGDRQGDGTGTSPQQQGKAIAAGMEGTRTGCPGRQRRLVWAVMEGMGKGGLVVTEVNGKGPPSWQGCPGGQRGPVEAIPVGMERTGQGHPGEMEGLALPSW